ncbi:MAG: IS3 family transposase [Gemmatimonadales bacterium]
MTTAQRRAVVAEARARHELTERRACRCPGVHRALVRCPSRREPQTARRACLRDLAATKVRWGSPRLTWKLRREGWLVNYKRIERRVREERLLVRRKRAAMARVPTPVPTCSDERWSMDFVRDGARAGW